MRIFLSLIQHMGDIIACEPAARLIKRLHKGATLTWVVSHRYAELVRYNPAVDAVMEVACLGDWVKTKPHLTDTIYDLNVNHNVCINCCGLQLHKSGPGTEVTCNNWYDFGPLLPTFLQGAGLPPVSDAPVFWRKPSGIAIATDLLGRPYVVIQPASNDVKRNWEQSKWQQLCDWLRALGYQVVEVGLEASGIQGVRYFKSRDFHDIACLISGAAAFIGVDSGFAHMANAYRIKSVLIFGKFRHWTHYFPYTGFFETGARIVRAGEQEAAFVPVEAVQTEFAQLMGT